MVSSTFLSDFTVLGSAQFNPCKFEAAKFVYPKHINKDCRICRILLLKIPEKIQSKHKMSFSRIIDLQKAAAGMQTGKGEKVRSLHGSGRAPHRHFYKIFALHAHLWQPPLSIFTVPTS